MGPKVQAACKWVTATGGFVGIGALGVTAEMVTGTAALASALASDSPHSVDFVVRQSTPDCVAFFQ
jgi:hypothetical protein